MSKHGIMVAVDGSAESDAAVRWAAREAVMREADVTLVHVVAPVVVTWPVGYLRSSFAESQEENAQQAIEQAQKIFQAEVGDAKLPGLKARVVHDYVAPGLVSASRQAEMIVAGSRGLGAISGSVLGSISRTLLHHAHCPVAVVHANETVAADPTLPVLVGIDGSPASESATALAFEEASRRGVDLVALHAWSDVGITPVLGMDWHEYEDLGNEVLAERLAGWQEQYPDVHIRRRIVCDRPARWLVDESQHSALVVLGSRGRGGFAGMLLGSVSTAVAEAAKCPVLVVRS
ncbi:universal stress protein [Mycolicibacterium stellerae]|uniref:universal stress protein n=1 Tax=Mycolicibacterium stellerae TaxID=2358193 RepID=UPI000F0B61E8|nr:universal stress protein [Mycolicibacterium stellerae]